MSIFVVLNFEPLVQVNDKTRLDLSQSYKSGPGNKISLYEIDPGNGSGFINVTNDKYLDIEYSTPGTKTIQARINNATNPPTVEDGPITKTYSIEVVTEEDDLLFSDDSMLISHEPSILLYLRKGKSSFKDIHRRAQTIILDWLDANRYWKRSNERYTKEDIVDIQDFKKWSAYLTLQLIFEGLSDKVDDKWQAKAKVYERLANEAKKRGTFRLDANSDGEITSGELKDNFSKGLIRS
jgi:hypothetical protein